MREWVFKLPFWLNDLLHCAQLYFSTPLWICLWSLSPVLLANVFGHWSQDLRSSILVEQTFPSHYCLTTEGEHSINSPIESESGDHSHSTKGEFLWLIDSAYLIALRILTELLLPTEIKACVVRISNWYRCFGEVIPQ